MESLFTLVWYDMVQFHSTCTNKCNIVCWGFFLVVSFNELFFTAKSTSAVRVLINLFQYHDSIILKKLCAENWLVNFCPIEELLRADRLIAVQSTKEANSPGTVCCTVDHFHPPFKCVLWFCSEEVDMIFELKLEHMVFVNAIFLLRRVYSIAKQWQTG